MNEGFLPLACACTVLVGMLAAEDMPATDKLVSISQIIPALEQLGEGWYSNGVWALIAELAGSLWDSRWRRALSGQTAAGLFAGSDVNLWDSRSPYSRQLIQNLKLARASTRSFLRNLDGRPDFYALWDANEI